MKMSFYTVNGSLKSVKYGESFFGKATLIIFKLSGSLVVYFNSKVSVWFFLRKKWYTLVEITDKEVST